MTLLRLHVCCLSALLLMPRGLLAFQRYVSQEEKAALYEEAWRRQRQPADLREAAAHELDLAREKEQEWRSRMQFAVADRGEVAEEQVQEMQEVPGASVFGAQQPRLSNFVQRQPAAPTVPAVGRSSRNARVSRPSFSQAFESGGRYWQSSASSSVEDFAEEALQASAKLSEDAVELSNAVKAVALRLDSRHGLTPEDAAEKARALGLLADAAATTVHALDNIRENSEVSAQVLADSRREVASPVAAAAAAGATAATAPAPDPGASATTTAAASSTVASAEQDAEQAGETDENATAKDYDKWHQKVREWRVPLKILTFNHKTTEWQSYILWIIGMFLVCLSCACCARML
eukprot:TRINITY_DN35303_c0_g1_i1.p1 TRINITY_DN35303_c0_g1~~TRINITY_DN35303_c0_g1_i1.p1  ORF type:complete len:349 (-),score=104.28 TRINITY_DN35303_c0_g1_i1:127-1173(-)